MKILPAKNLKLSNLDSFKEYVRSKKFIKTNEIKVFESNEFLVFDSSLCIKSPFWEDTHRRMAILEKEKFRVEGNSIDNSLTFFRYKEFTPNNFYSRDQQTYDSLYSCIYKQSNLKDSDVERYLENNPYSKEIPFLTLEIVHGIKKIRMLQEGLIDNNYKTSYYLKYYKKNKKINEKYRFKQYRYGD